VFFTCRSKEMYSYQKKVDLVFGTRLFGVVLILSTNQKYPSICYDFMKNHGEIQVEWISKNNLKFHKKYDVRNWTQILILRMHQITARVFLS